MKQCVLVICRGRKDRVPLKSDFTRFVGEIGAVQAESNSEEFPFQLCPLHRKMIRNIHVFALSGNLAPPHPVGSFLFSDKQANKQTG